MKVGGQIPWNVTPICETSQIYFFGFSSGEHTDATRLTHSTDTRSRKRLADVRKDRISDGCDPTARLAREISSGTDGPRTARELRHGRVCMHTRAAVWIDILVATRVDDLIWASEPRAEHITHEVQNIFIFGLGRSLDESANRGTRRPNSCA